MPPSQQLSRDAYDRLKAELDDLTTRGRIEIANKIEEARLLGDLSENGDYHAAKEEQGKMEGRIMHLQSTLENCVIVEHEHDDTVIAGCVVEIRYEGDDVTETYLYGSIEERVGDYDVLTPGSPLGEALAGAEAGHTVSFEAPSGATIAVEVVAVSRPG